MLKIFRPCDFHVHLREGQILKHVLKENNKNEITDKYQVLRTHIEVTKPGKHMMRLQGKLSQMNLFLEKEKIEFPPNGGEVDFLVDCKTTGKQEILLVLRGADSTEFSLEALSEDLRMNKTF